MSKIKILTITTSGLERKEGISTIILDYYSFFNKNKFQLNIIASGNYDSKLVAEFKKSAVNVKFLPSRKNSLMNYIWELAKLMKEEKYDAIYLHGSSAIMVIELILAIVYGIKIRVVHSHNTTCDHKKIDKILRPLFYKCYTRALACGVDAGKWLYGKRPFDIIKNGRNVDTYKYDTNKRINIRNNLGISDNILLIGHVGNFNSQKNQKFLIPVFEEILKIHPIAKLFLIGDGPQKNIVMKMVREKGIQDKVIFTGSVANVPDLLQAMDVMLLPSLHEGLPLVVIEWQIAGLPTIVSDFVTKECAYTDYVYFLPLKDPLIWAKKTLEIVNINRRENQDDTLRLTKEYGYDLQENAYKLQKYFEI